MDKSEEGFYILKRVNNGSYAGIAAVARGLTKQLSDIRFYAFGFSGRGIALEGLSFCV